MANRSLEFRVGAFLLGAVGVGLALVIALGNFSLGPGKKFRVDYDYIGSLQEGAAVKLAGVRVGKVTDVAFMAGELDATVGRRVYVRTTIWVEKKALPAVGKDAAFFINTAGVLGEQYIEIVPGADVALLAPGSIVRGMDPPRVDLVVSRLFDVVDGLASVLATERSQVSSLLRNGAATVEELHALLVANREQIPALLKNAGALAGSGARFLDRVPEAEVAQLLRSADATLQAGKRALDENSPKVGRALEAATSGLQTITPERVDRALVVADKAATAADAASGLLGEARSLLADARKGKGTVGALLVNDEIYADVREMVEDLKRNPWKFFWKE
ncbi:MAG: MCE family protein [Myxococcales bacterium]|nr:MCE family protein [Myxococcales bacterium]